MRKQVLMLSIFVMIIAMPFVMGAEICDYLTKDLGLSTGVTIPSSIPYKNEVFNVYSNKDTIEGTFTIANGTVTNFTCDVISKDNTYDIFVKDKKTVKDLEEADDKLGAFNSALGDFIEIKGKTFGKKSKMFFTRIALTISSWFS